ncbi:hypothetical protein KC351_g931 [Hortaea werneckii]|nr:hypothetical protein KC351_g931 [Hortaea werneckii]
MAAATVAPPELTRFIGNCCPDHGGRTSSRLRTTVVVVVVVVVFFFFYGTSHSTALFFAADFAPWASDIFFVIGIRTSSTAAIHAHYLLFKLYPASWTTFDVSVTNFLYSTIVIWAVHSLVVHWTANLSTASLLHPINLFIVHWAANFSSASALYRVNFFILHWTAHISSASTLYRVNFFILHWSANPPSVYHLHPTKFFVVHWSAHYTTGFPSPSGSYTAWLPPYDTRPPITVTETPSCPSPTSTCVAPVDPTCPVVPPTTVTETPSCPSPTDTCPTPVDPTCPSVPTETVTVPAPCVPTSYVNFGGYTRAGCPRQLPDGERDDNVEVRQLGIVNGTTPADGQCVRFSRAVSSVIYFLTGTQLPEDCEIGYYETYDCTDGAFRTLGLVEQEQTCSSPGRKTRSLKITCGGGYGPHY